MNATIAYISTEFHIAQGPCTLVPLPGRRSAGWVTEPEKAEHLRHYEDAALGAQIEKQTHSVLGRMTSTARAAWCRLSVSP